MRPSSSPDPIQTVAPPGQDSGASAPQSVAVGPCERTLAWALEAQASAELRFALLRGHEVGAGERAGSDFDLIVHPQDQSAWLACLEAACEQTGTRIVRRQVSAHSTHLLLHAHPATGEHHFLAVDLHSAEVCYGVRFWGADDLLPAAVRTPIARLRTDGESPAVTAPALTPLWRELVRFWVGYLPAGSLRAPLIETWQQAPKAERDAVAAALLRLLGPHRSDAMLAALLQGNREALVTQYKTVRRTLLARRLRRAPLATLGQAVRFVWQARVEPFWKPRGLCMAFLGTDGSGKSTLIEAVRSTLEPHFRDGGCHMHRLRPGLLPQINRLFHWKGVTYDADDCSRPTAPPRQAPWARPCEPSGTPSTA
ncbi:MAG: hypothetical protein R3F17_02490 [Planctomycetota bacterium]